MFSPEHRLLMLSCLPGSPAGAAEQAATIIHDNRIDWQDVYNRAEFHCVRPQVAELLQRLPGTPVTDQLITDLDDAVQENLLRQLRYVSGFFEIRDRLEEEDIAVVPFKGFWMGEEFYGNMAHRESSDMDLFIQRHDIARIKPIMTGMGYVEQESLLTLTDDYIFNELAEYNFQLFGDGRCISHVEFHWSSSKAFYGMNIGMDDLRPQIVTGMIQGRELKVFSPAANLLLAVMHHGGKECYLQLKQVLDIAHIMRRYPDLDTEWLLHQARRFHVSSLLYLGVSLASELTGVEVPEALAEQVGKRRISRMAAGRMLLASRPTAELAGYRESLASWVFKIRSRDGLAMKLRLCRYTLRKVIAPRLVPERWRHHFFNSRIRRNPAA